ncbi:MAG: hypothetical protein U0R68_04775 [Candidatus Nanopelagicales bacterium]
MSEPMFPTATAEEAVPFAAPAEEAAGSGGNRKALLAVGGVVAALVVGGGAFFLLTGSGSGGSDEAFVPTVPQKSAAPSAKPQASGGTTVVKVKPVTVAAGHDPFAPLFAVVSANQGTSGTGVTTTTGTTTTTTTSSGGGTTTTTGSGTGTTASSVTLSVTAIDTVAQTATISVDGKKYATTVGTPFGQYYMMYSVFNDTCVGVLAGDSSIAVCTTKPVTVTP